ncbi:MAG: hypothetical protein IKW81_07435 [Pseudobutyrivibrio sp.]|nr:hypothetical protein [Pseudobutyrivibrio sp.]
MGRKSKDEQGIDIICEGNGIDPDVDYELTMMMFEHHSRSVVAGKMLSSIVKLANPDKVRRQMRKDFLWVVNQPISESKDMQQRLLWQVSEYEWLIEPRDYILEGMKDYGNSGPIYHKIITDYYLRKDRKTVDELAKELGFSRASIENKKREAIKLFGIMMYRYAYEKEQEEAEKEDNTHN